MGNATDRPSTDSPSALAVHTTSSNLLSDALGWTTDNVAKPLVNSAILTPWNAIASTTNELTGHSAKNPLLPEAGLFEVPKAQFLSAQWLAQGISGGLGAIAPYIVAGRVTGGAMRFSGEALGVEGKTAQIFQNGKIAQIAGAGIYDGMRDPGQGETRLGNALAGASMFSVFEYGNGFGKNFNFAGQIGKRAAIGFAGAEAGQTVSHLVSEQKLPTFDQYAQAGISGAILNVALPPTQHALLKAVDGVNHSLGRGVPIDRYLGVQQDFTTSKTFSDLVGKNSWSRVQTGASADAANLSTKVVELQGTTPNAARLGHELFHLQAAKDPEVIAKYDQAATLLNSGKTAEAKDLFFSTHLQTELNARQIEAKIAAETGARSNAGNIDTQVAQGQSHDGQTYLQDTELAFQRFVASNGKERPNIEYGGIDSLPPANNNIPRPASLLAKGEGEGDIYDNKNSTVTKIYYDKSVDAAQKRAMYTRLESIGVRVPKIYDHGTTADGQPALVIEKVGDGDNLKFQLISGELSPADKESVRRQYYEMGDTLQRNGISVDWNLGNMRFENGKLYLLDPSFIKETPMNSAFVDMFGRSLGPRS
jgi:hypothetical protein